MGGGTESTTKQDKSTSVSTETVTNVGDIGVFGEDLTGIVQALSGAVAVSANSAKEIVKLGLSGVPADSTDLGSSGSAVSDDENVPEGIEQAGDFLAEIAPVALAGIGLFFAIREFSK